MEPVRDGLAGLDAVLSVANSLPYFQEKAPGLQDIQDSLENLSSLQADVQQLRTTIRAAAEGRSDELTDQTTTLLLNITQRVDDRLALTQSNLEELKSKVDDLKERIAQKKSELLFIINLIAVVATLLYLWLIYSQIVVIRVQVEKMRSPRKIEEKESSDEAPMVLDAPTVDMLSNQYRESLEPQPEATTGSEPESPPEA